jgi:hypothetical protein
MSIGFANPYGILKFHRVDLICRPVFKRFVSWIQFVTPKISKYLICIDWAGFVYKDITAYATMSGLF